MSEDKQNKFDAVQAAYLKALYGRPRDEARCLELAGELLELARGTRLEDRQRGVLERHLKEVKKAGEQT